MIDAFTSWLHNKFGARKQPATSHSLELCTAVLYHEIIRADSEYHADEIDAFKQIAIQELHVTESEWLDFEALSRAQAEQSVDLVQFTQVINQHCDLPQRRHILDKLWQLAHADGRLDPHEEYIIRKISDLLHLPHSQYIQSKLANK